MRSCLSQRPPFLGANWPADQTGVSVYYQPRPQAPQVIAVPPAPPHVTACLYWKLGGGVRAGAGGGPSLVAVR